MLNVNLNNRKLKITFKHTGEQVGVNPDNNKPIMNYTGSTCSIEEDGEVIATGKANKSDKDFFNRNKGRRVGLSRALKNLKENERINKEEKEAIWTAYFQMRHGKY